MEGQYIGMAAVLLIFGVIPVTLALVLFKLRARQMDTLVKLVQHGATLDADTIRLMSGSAGNYKTDYKWGLFWLAVGLPATAGIWILAGIGLAVWGLIPVFFGVAFLIAGKLRLREPDDKPS